MVDYRRLHEAAELAGARDRERRATQLLRLQLPAPCGIGEPFDLHAELVHRLVVAAADDGDYESLLRLHGEAEVVTVEVDDGVALEPRVQLGVFHERRRARLEHSWDEQFQIDG